MPRRPRMVVCSLDYIHVYLFIYLFLGIAFIGANRFTEITCSNVCPISRVLI